MDNTTPLTNRVQSTTRINGSILNLKKKKEEEKKRKRKERRGERAIKF